MIFKATENNEECSSGPLEESEQISETQPKTLRITVTKIPSSLWLPVTITLLVFLVLGISMITVLSYCWHQKKKYQDSKTNKHLKSTAEQDQNNKVEVEVETTIASDYRETQGTYKKGKGSFS